MIIKIICGFFMALADSVPGVSGGTIAFLLGQYDNFINSLNNIIAGTMKQKKRGNSFFNTVDDRLGNWFYTCCTDINGCF